MCRTKYYRDAYGSTAKCVPCEGGYYSVTVRMGDVSQHRLCPDMAHAMRFINAYGFSWTEVERWA